MKRVIANVKQILTLLKRNPFRTILLVIGLIITSITFSAGDIVTSNMVLSSSIKYENFSPNAVLMNGMLELEDLKNINEFDSNIKYVSYYINPFMDAIELENDEKLPIKIYSCMNEFYKYPLISSDTSDSLEISLLIAGRSFTDEDKKFNRKVVILHSLVARMMFENSNCIGETITVAGKGSYEIIGVLKDTPDILRTVNNLSKNGNGSIPIYIPNLSNSYNATVCLAPEAINQNYANRINDFCMKKSADTYLKSYTYDYHKKTIEQDKKDTQMALNLLLVVMYTISTIFIFSIMLFFVKERVVEIGVRKSIGARASDITFHFMFEMFFLSLISSVIGTVIGVFCGAVLSFIMTASIGLPSVVIGLKATLLPILISVEVAMISGLIPSVIASKMSIKECLQFD